MRRMKMNIALWVVQGLLALVRNFNPDLAAAALDSEAATQLSNQFLDDVIQARPFAIEDPIR